MDGELPIVEYWYLALAQPLGIVIQVSDAKRFKQKLYQARTKAGDPQLAALMILTSPTNQQGELFIAHRHVDLQPENLTNVER